jgi:hypothetical protein
MKGPAFTWRVRRLGRSLWSSAHARTKSGWLVVDATLTRARNSTPAAACTAAWSSALRADGFQIAVRTVTTGN